MVVQFFPRSQTLENQRHEKLVVSTHVFGKTFQATAALAPVAYGALRLFRRPVPYATVLARGYLAACCFSAARAAYMLATSDEAKNKARAFRLQRNLDMYFLEDWTFLGAALGLATTRLLPAWGPLASGVLGGSLGFYFALAVLLGVRYTLLPGELFNAINFSSPKD